MLQCQLFQQHPSTAQHSSSSGLAKSSLTRQSSPGLVRMNQCISKGWFLRSIIINSSVEIIIQDCSKASAQTSQVQVIPHHPTHTPDLQMNLRGFTNFRAGAPATWSYVGCVSGAEGYHPQCVLPSSSLRQSMDFWHLALPSGQKCSRGQKCAEHSPPLNLQNATRSAIFK